MPACPKFFLLILIALSAIFLFLPRAVFADVVLNELLPNPSNPPDWVELFNGDNEAVDLEGWSLIDSTSEILTIHGATISAHGFLVFDVTNRLNQDKDQIHLLNQNDEEQDIYEYTSNPGTDVSYGRMPDGEDWGICQVPTKGGSNSCVVPTPTPEPEDKDEEESTSPNPTFTPTPTPKSSPTPTKKPTPTKTPTPTPSGEILGEEATPEAEVISFNVSQESTPSSFNLQNLLPFVFVGLGSLLLAIAGGSVLLPKMKKRYNIRKRGKSEETI